MNKDLHWKQWTLIYCWMCGQFVRDTPYRIHPSDCREYSGSRTVHG